MGWKAFANASNDGKKRSLTGQLCKYIRSKEDTICLSIRVIEDNEICKTIHELYEEGMCMWHVRRVRRVQVASKSVLSCTEYPLFYRYNSSSYFFGSGRLFDYDQNDEYNINRTSLFTQANIVFVDIMIINRDMKTNIIIMMEYGLHIYMYIRGLHIVYYIC